MRAVPLALAALALVACAEPLESRLLPSPLHRVSLGMSPGVLARERPATEPVACTGSVEAGDRCVRERRPVAGIRAVSYRFANERLVELRAELEPGPFVPGAVESRLAGMKGLGELGPPDVHLATRSFARVMALGWRVGDRRVEAAFELQDPSAPGGNGGAVPPGETLLRPSLTLAFGAGEPAGVPSSLEEGQAALAAFAERARLRAELLAGAWAPELDPGYCRRFGELVPAASLCTAALAAVEGGRVGSKERAAIAEALSSHGYRALSGTVTARIYDGLYEVEPARAGALIEAGGSPARVRAPEGKFRGRVQVVLYVRPRAGERPETFEEDAVGAGVRRLFAASPGDDVRTAARELLARAVRTAGP